MWFCRKVRHVCDGGFFWRILYLSIVESATSCPRSSSSDLILGVPQAGFSLDICRISLRSPGSILGRPPRLFRDFQRRYSLKPCLCQRMTVSGCTMIKEDFHPSQIFDSHTQKIRSRLRSLGRLTDLFITANCWRSTRFSARSSALETNKLRRNSNNAFIYSIKVLAPDFSGQDTRRLENWQFS